MWDTAAALNRTAEPNLQSLEKQLAGRQEPLKAVQRLQTLLGTLLGYTAAIPFWRNPGISLEVLAEQVDLYDWYRCAKLLSHLPARVHPTRVERCPLGTDYFLPCCQSQQESPWEEVLSYSRTDICLVRLGGIQL